MTTAVVGGPDVPEDLAVRAGDLLEVAAASVTKIRVRTTSLGPGARLAERARR